MGLYETRVEPCLEAVKQFAASGLTNEDIADRFNIKEKAFADYVKLHHNLARALRQGRRDMVLRVENTVYGLAIGDEHIQQIEIRKKRTKVGVDEDGEPIYKMVVDQKIYKRGPNFEAAKYYLEQRAPDRWAKVPVTSDAAPINESIQSVADLINDPVGIREVGDEDDD